MQRLCHLLNLWIVCLLNKYVRSKKQKLYDRFILLKGRFCLMKFWEKVF